MFGARTSWVRVLKHFQKNSQQQRQFCNLKQPQNNTNGVNNSNINNNNINSIRNLEAYRDLDKLDFMKAAKILFSEPPKMKQFGLDFHLVQLFFALMPSLAVYLVAQYARYEIRTMEAELEQKKKAEEEKKAKEMEALAAEEKETSDPELSKVKERLETLEKTVKEIVVETKKTPSDEKSKNLVHNQVKEDSKSKSDNSDAASGSPPTHEKATPASDKQQKNQDSEKIGSHHDEKK